jgi:translocation and assembly module TamB
LKRFLKYLIIIAFLATLVICFIYIAWLLRTNEGARRLVDFVSVYTDVKISAEKIEGRLAGDLLLENVEIRAPHLLIKARRLEMNTQTGRLMAGGLIVENLFIEDLAVYDNTPKQPQMPDWPEVPVLAKFVRARINVLKISNISYYRPDESPLLIRNISAAIDWKNAQLSVQNLQLAADSAVVEGNLLAGFGRPLLKLNLAVNLSEPAAGLSYFGLEGKFQAGQNPQKLNGKFHLSGRREAADKKPSWEMSSDAGMTSTGFILQNILLGRPDRQGKITANAKLDFSEDEPFVNLQAEITDFDLASELKIPALFFASLTFVGTADKYEGKIALSNKTKSRESFHLTGNYSGTGQNLTLQNLQGKALDGNLSGSLQIDWKETLTAKYSFRARNIDPRAFDPTWTGVINFDASGRVSALPGQAISGEVSAKLLDSRLHGQQLTGRLQADFKGDDLRIADLFLQGKGFQLSARGALLRGIDFTARVSDLSLLIPGSAGALTAVGTARHVHGRTSGSVTAVARDLSLNGLEIQSANLAASIKDADQSPIELSAFVNSMRYQGFSADTLKLAAQGTMSRHTLTATMRGGPYMTNLSASGAYLEGLWQGEISRLEGTDKVGSWRLLQPAKLTVTSSSIDLQKMTLAGKETETLQLSGRMNSSLPTGDFFASWNNLNISRANSWIKSDLLSGSSDGNIKAELLPGEKIAFDGKCSLSGSFKATDQTIGIRQGNLILSGNEQGIRAKLNITLEQGGMVQASFSSAAPARLALPDNGDIALNVSQMDLAPLSPLLPGRSWIKGKIDAKANGKLLPNGRLGLSGRADLSSSKMRFRGQRGNVNLDLQSAAIAWIWQDDALTGNISLTMAQYGKLLGNFNLPLAARLPVSFNREGNLLISLSGDLREKGALGILFPDMVQESSGNLALDLKITGSPAKPQIAGKVSLTNSAGYLPSAGISFKEARLEARLENDVFYIDDFRAISGPGYIEGKASFRIKENRIESYEGRLSGERFQTIFFPELQVSSSPNLTFSGTPEKLSVRGEVLLPEVEIIGMQTSKSIEPSTDVIREGKAKRSDKKLPIDLDVKVTVILGEKVHFNASGIDAKLGGQIDLQFHDPEKISGRGEIRVIEGRFRTYGVNLEIVRGRLFYAGGQINQPLLDILALRKIGDIRAGVTVSGALPNPLVRLHSEPFMPDVDILAYIVLGHPLGGSREQASLMVMAAGALLTSKQSEDLQAQIKRRIGFDTLNITTDIVTQDSYMGYKRINVLPTGSNGTTDSSSETMLVVGKYLTPKLYVSYGRSLFSGGNLLFLRYNISKNWQIESQTGQESGVDVYYKLEFD